MFDREDFIFSHKLRVRWSEVDPQGIVFNPNYLVYADIAYTEYVRQVCGNAPSTDAAHTASQTVAAHSEVSYKSSARYDDELELCARVSAFGRTSFKVLVGIFRAEQLLAEITLTYVYVTKTDHSPTPVSEAFKAQIRHFEKTPPTQK